MPYAVHPRRLQAAARLTRRLLPSLTALCTQLAKKEGEQRPLASAGQIFGVLGALLQLVQTVTVHLASIGYQFQSDYSDAKVFLISSGSPLLGLLQGNDMGILAEGKSNFNWHTNKQ